MDIYKEISNFRKLWNERTFLGKAVLLFAFVLSILSVGSLADTVYDFKGFILNGIEFYRNVTEPVRLYVSNIINMNIPQGLQDGLVIICIYMSSVLRIRGESIQRRGWQWFMCYTISILLVIFIGWFLLKYISMSLLFLIYGPLIPVCYALSCNERFRLSSTDRMQVVFILGVYFTTAVIAAISEGLSRSV